MSLEQFSGTYYPLDTESITSGYLDMTRPLRT